MRGKILIIINIYIKRERERRERDLFLGNPSSLFAFPHVVPNVRKMIRQPVLKDDFFTDRIMRRALVSLSSDFDFDIR